MYRSKLVHRDPSYLFEVQIHLDKLGSQKIQMHDLAQN